MTSKHLQNERPHSRFGLMWRCIGPLRLTVMSAQRRLAHSGRLAHDSITVPIALSPRIFSPVSESTGLSALAHLRLIYIALAHEIAPRHRSGCLYRNSVYNYQGCPSLIPRFAMDVPVSAYSPVLAGAVIAILSVFTRRAPLLLD
jgi:hypothetical protein